MGELQSHDGAPPFDNLTYKRWEKRRGKNQSQEGLA